MKNLKFLMIGLLFVGLAGLTSCKKEKQIEKNLWNKGGEWNIVKVVDNWSWYGQSNSETLYNRGTFKFEKDGNGKITIKDDGDTFSNLFTYKNTENSLTLTYKEGPIYSEGEREEYTLDWEKDKIELYSYESDEDGYDELFITLEKK